MDKIYLIYCKGDLLRAYNSRREAEKYYYHVMDSLKAGRKFTKNQASVENDIRLAAVPVCKEGDDLDMRLGNCHAGGGSQVITYELCSV